MKHYWDEDAPSAVGRIHSFQSMGAVDGPGMRCVLFLQGCPLRCAYCHNPDTWAYEGGVATTAQDEARRILRYRPYIRRGGVTVSGGEPLGQPEFVAELFGRLRQEGLHTALDTSGVGGRDAAAQVLEETDLVLCDIKFPTEEGYQAHTGGSLAAVLGFLEQVRERRIPLWIRHGVVPGLTDGEASLRQVGRLAQACPTLEKLELLPFRKLCVSKYDALGIPFPLEGAPEMDAAGLAHARELLQKEGLPVG